MEKSKNFNRFITWKEAFCADAKGTWYCFMLRPWTTLLSVGLYFGMNILGPVVIWAQSKLIGIVGNINNPGTVKLFSGMLLIWMFAYAFYEYKGNIALPVNALIAYSVRFYCTEHIYQAIQKVPLTDLDKEEKVTGIERALRKAEKLQGEVMMFSEVSGDICSLLILWCTMLTFPNGIVYILACIIFTLAGRLFDLKNTEEKTMLNRKQMLDERKSEYYNDLQMSRESVSEIKMDKLYKYFQDKWKLTYNKAMQARIILRNLYTRKKLISDILEAFIYGGILTVLIKDTAAGRMPLTSSVYIFGAISTIRYNLRNIVGAAQISYESGIALDEIDEYVRAGNCAVNNIQSSPVALNNADPILEMQNVSFSYDGIHPVINKVNFSLNKGEIIALVGPNGGGKSTLMKLALGLMPPDFGSIKLCGQPIDKIPENERRGLVSAAFQDYMRFQLTLRENIGFGNLNEIKSDESICNAIYRGDSKSVLERVISLETCLGREFDEDGLELSGGEWQRIAVSRAFMGEPSVFVFDEPSAALDPLAELHQFERLREFLNGRSGILVTHRVGLARLADKIVYLDQGHIAEQGTHSELMAHHGAYANLFSEQAKWYYIEDEDRKCGA